MKKASLSELAAPAYERLIREAKDAQTLESYLGFAHQFEGVAPALDEEIAKGRQRLQQRASADRRRARAVKIKWPVPVRLVRHPGTGQSPPAKL